MSSFPFKIRLLFLLFLLNGIGAFAQNGPLSTRIFNARDGLPDNKVAFLLETRNSPFRWAATNTELCRFDGYRFTTVWEKMPEIKGLAENSRGELVLWHLDDFQSISLFEPEKGLKTTRKISEMPGLRGKLVRAWAQDTMIFLSLKINPSAEYEVWRLFPDFKIRLIQRIQLDASGPRFQIPPEPIPVCQWDEETQALWLAQDFSDGAKNILRFSPATGRLDSISLSDGRFSEKMDWTNWLNIAMPTGANGPLLLFSGMTSNLWKCSPTTGKCTVFSRKPGENPGLNLLVGMDRKGAMIFLKPTGGTQELWLLRADGTWLDLKKQLPDLHFLTCAGADFSRQIHFGTLEGVLRVNFERPLFQKFSPAKGDFNEFGNPAFRGIAADPTGKIWAFAEMLGLFGQRPDGSFEKTTVRERLSGKPVLTNNAVNLLADSGGFLWSARNVISDFNLMRIDPKTGLADTFSIKKHRITTFTLLKNGSILAAATDEKTVSLILLNPETRQQTRLFSGDELKSSPLFLLENSASKIWVGGNEGLALFNRTTQKLEPFSGDGPTAREFPVSIIFAEGDDILWLGTLGGGLRKLNLKTGDWQIFTMKNGLPANKIAGILPDGSTGSPTDGSSTGLNFWVSTFDGLSFFQPETQLFTNFFTQNGLSHNEFNRFSFFKKDGPTGSTLFFGGLSGLNFFNPTELLGSFSQGNDSLLISQISWFDADGKTRLEQTLGLQNLEQITLPPENRFCNIRLALANFLQPEANRFAWKFDGETDWHSLGTGNEITFHYLPAGTYRLRIKAANPTGIWGKNERVITLVVREFWYKTDWFFGLLAVAVLGLFFLYYRFKLNKKLGDAERLRLKEIDALRTRLYTNITHEFRTPLTVILGMADQIRGHETERKLIARNGQNLLRLINQLLDLSKLDSGMMRLKMVRGDVVNYLQYLTESFHSMAQERGVRLVFYPETARLDMDFDEEKLQHIVFNLLSNALKFIPPGRDGKVVLHAAEIERGNQPFLQLKVQDTGAGIAESQLPQIFDRFFQADHSAMRKSEGTGIGLALTKELVELMGGSIGVESRVGQGSVFTVLLPIQRAEGVRKLEDASQVSPVLERSIDSQPPAKIGNPKSEIGNEKPLLLLIEDNADVVTYIVGILSNDYEIRVARNGREGIEMAFEIVPDIVISDVMMPEKDGYEVCKTLKTDERTSHIPLILLTAKAAHEDKLAGLRVGADAYLQKPFDKNELFIRLEKLVALRRALQGKYAVGSSVFSKNGVEKLSAAPTLDDLFLEKIRRVIFEKMSDSELGIVHLCRAASLSHTQVFRKLKALTGENPTLFIRRMRLERAAELLKTTELNVSEIAYEVGFSDPNYFSRAFHETFGASPGTIRK